MTRASILILIVFLAGMLSACGLSSADTPVPTYEPVIIYVTETPLPKPEVTPSPTAEVSSAADEIEEDLEIIQQYVTRLDQGTASVFPLDGMIDFPVKITISVVSGEVDPALTIRNSAGNTVITSDSTGAGEQEILRQFQFPVQGMYQLELVTMGESGEVLVSVYRLDPESLTGGGTFTSTDDQLSGQITEPEMSHTYRIPATRGERIDIWAEAQASDLDLLFQLYSPDGVLVTAKDDNVGLDPYLWNFMPSQTGLYSVVVSNYDENIGDYKVSVTPSSGSGELEIDTVTQFELPTTPRKSVWFTLQGTAQDGISIHMQPQTGGVDLAFSVYDPFGNEIVYINDRSTGWSEKMGTLQFPYDGEYQIEIYTLQAGGVIDLTVTGQTFAEINEGGVVETGLEGRSGLFLGTSSMHVFAFAGTDGDLINIDIHAKPGWALNLDFNLYSAEGFLLATGDTTLGRNPRLVGFTLPESGTYFITVWNVERTFGHYEVIVMSGSQ